MLKYNESAHLSVCIYSIIFVGLVIIPNITWLSESNNTRFILACVGILVVNTTINLVLFGPKWLAIKADKKEKNSTSSLGRSSSAQISTANAVLSQEGEK